MSGQVFYLLYTVVGVCLFLTLAQDCYHRNQIRIYPAPMLLVFLFSFSSPQTSVLLVISQEGKQKQRKCLSQSHDESVIKGALPVSSHSGGTSEVATPDAPSPQALPLSHQSRPVFLANPRRTSDPTPDLSSEQNLLCWPLLILPQSCSPISPWHPLSYLPDHRH